MKKNKYIIIAIVATVILLIGIVYLVKDNNSIFNNKIDIYNNENSNNDEVSIDLKLEVQKEGYLKDIVISMQPKDEQSILNYELKEIKDNETSAVK